MERPAKSVKKVIRVTRCPKCSALISCDLARHFVSEHGREPTKVELAQFWTRIPNSKGSSGVAKSQVGQAKACASKSKRKSKVPLVVDPNEFIPKTTRLEKLPLEYQASVYAKKLAVKAAKAQLKNKHDLEKLKTSLRDMKARLSSTFGESAVIQLHQQIADVEKKIKSAPRPKNKWSPVLAGSFESRSR